jgi:small redox-active disulfide protein 2
MKIQIIGTGCPKCRILLENAKKAADDLGVQYEIEKITDPDDIVEFGVMMTPGLAVNNDVKSAGKLLTTDQIKSILKEKG